MGLGIRKIFRSLNSGVTSVKFSLRNFFLGFDNACLLLKYADKNALTGILRKHGASVGENCDIETGLTFHNCTDFSNLIIGDNSHVGKNCFFDLAGKVEIGNNAVISMNTSFLTHINIHKSELEDIYPSRISGIKVGDNVYIGAGCILLMGVEIGSSSLVAAGSTVTKSFEPCSFIAGTPAKFKKTIQK